MRRHSLLFFTLLLLFFSCRKHNDSNPPSVSVASPAAQTNYNVYDTITVTFSATDDIGLENYTVKLENADLFPVEPAFTGSMNGTSQTISFQFVIDNIRIESGGHYLYIEVSDGNNTAHTFVPVYITEAPRIFKGVFAVTMPVLNTRNVYKADTSWTAGLFYTGSGDFRDMEVSSYWQQVIFGGEYNGSLKNMSIDGTTSGWSVNAISGPSPYWSDLSTYTARYNVSVPGLSRMQSYDETGRLLASYTADNGYNFIKQFQVNSRIYTEQKDIASSAEKLVVYSTSGGALQEAMLTGSVVAMFSKDVDNIYVLSNSAGQGLLNIYDYNANGFWSPIALPAGATILSATQIDTNTLYIAMSNGNVYKFTYNPVGLISQTSGIHPTRMFYNLPDDQLITSEATSVKIWDRTGFSLQHTINFPDTVRDISPWYSH